MVLHPLHANAHVLRDPAIAGAVVNKNNVHWVALKCIDDRIWLLDSSDRPMPLADQEYMAFIDQYPPPVNHFVLFLLGWWMCVNGA